MSDTNSPFSQANYYHGKRALGIRILIIANACAALAMLAMAPQYSGGRSLLYLCVGLMHGLLAAGIFFRYNWARVVTVVYALFQAAGMALWSLIGLLTLMAEPLDRDKAAFLLLSALIIPFLVWSVVYLLRQMTRESRAPGQ